MVVRKGNNMAKMTLQEKLDFDELYQYVRSEVMGYDENQSLSNQMVLRLKGLSSGKIYENKREKRKASYSYKIILLTFKFCMPQIKKALIKKTFDSEMQKFNYILAIINNNINTVYSRTKQKKESDNKVKQMDFSKYENYNQWNYYEREKQKDNHRLKNLW